MASITEVVGSRVREAREEKGWKMARLGRELEPYLGQAWSSEVMAQAERGEREFTAKELVALGLVLGFSIGHFFRPHWGQTVELPRRRRRPRAQGGGFENLDPRSVSMDELLPLILDASEIQREVSGIENRIQALLEAGRALGIPLAISPTGDVDATRTPAPRPLQPSREEDVRAALRAVGLSPQEVDRAMANLESQKERGE